MIHQKSNTYKGIRLWFGTCFNVSLSSCWNFELSCMFISSFFRCFTTWWYTKTPSCYTINDITIEIDNKQVKGDILLEQSILHSESIKFDKKIANEPFTNRIIATKQVEPLDDFFHAQLQEQLNNRKGEGHITPELCIQAVKAAAESKSFEDGIKRERERLIRYHELVQI